MSFEETLRRQITLNTRDVLSSPALHALVAQECRDLRDQAIARGQAPKAYRTYVDGKRNGREENVRLDGGTVIYQFSILSQAAYWALSECQKRSPVHSGNYRSSWVLMVNGVVWQGLDAIPQDATVWIVNVTPYSRKIETGGMRIRVPPGIVEAVRLAVMRRFSGLKAQRLYLPMSGARDHRGNPTPYILRQAGIASGFSWNKDTKSWRRKHAAYVSPRMDRQAGEQLLYPTLVLTQ